MVAGNGLRTALASCACACALVGLALVSAGCGDDALPRFARPPAVDGGARRDGGQGPRDSGQARDGDEDAGADAE